MTFKIGHEFEIKADFALLSRPAGNHGPAVHAWLQDSPVM